MIKRIHSEKFYAFICVIFSCWKDALFIYIYPSPWYKQHKDKYNKRLFSSLEIKQANSSKVQWLTTVITIFSLSSSLTKVLWNRKDFWCVLVVNSCSLPLWDNKILLVNSLHRGTLNIMNLTWFDFKILCKEEALHGKLSMGFFHNKSSLTNTLTLSTSI